MVVFNGTIKVKVVEAKDLSPTETSIRLYSVVGQANKSPQLDAYVNVDLDEIMIGQTKTIAKCVTPLWNEEFSSEVHNGKSIGFTVFHDCAIPPDDFVANCHIEFADLDTSKPTHDLWMDLEPSGRIHVVVEMRGTAMEGV